MNNIVPCNSLTCVQIYSDFRGYSEKQVDKHKSSRGILDRAQLDLVFVHGAQLHGVRLTELTVQLQHILYIVKLNESRLSLDFSFS